MSLYWELNYVTQASPKVLKWDFLARRMTSVSLFFHMSGADRGQGWGFRWLHSSPARSVASPTGALGLRSGGLCLAKFIL